MADRLDVLRSSVDHLHALVGGLADDQLVVQAYTTKWSIADVLSHLGSGAVIMRRRLEDALVGEVTPEDFNPSVWDRWNAKSPREKANDALVADRQLLERFEAVAAGERAGLRIPFGPMQLDFETAVGMRLAEHVIHTWDIEVVLAPGRGLPSEAAALIVEGLPRIVAFAGKPTGATLTVDVRTSDPERELTIGVTPEAVTMGGGTSGAGPTLELPTESLVRLVYGRLDPGHTPAGVRDASGSLEELRKAFPGF